MNNVLAPTTFTTLLVADQGANDADPSLTKSGADYAAVCAEFQSTTGGVLLPRMTQAQIDALPLPGQALIPGTIVYNSTLGIMQTVDSGNSFSSSGALLTASGVLTAAEFDGMYAAPIMLIDPAPAGYGIFISKLTLSYNYVAVFKNGDNIFLQYDDTPLGASTYVASGVIARTSFLLAASSVTSAEGANLLGLPTAAINGAAVYISNAADAFIEGLGSTVRYSIQYMILPVL